MIAINQQVTDFALEDALRERNHLPVTTTTASLRRISSGNFFHLTASLFRFARQDSEKATPRHVRNTPRQMVIPDHPAHVQIFDPNHFKVGDQLPSFFVVKVFAHSRDLNMPERDSQPRLLAVRAALPLAAQSPLFAFQLLLGSFKRARVRDPLARGEGREAGDPDIKANFDTSRGQRRRLGQVTDQERIPAINAAPDPQLLDRAFNGAAESDSDCADAWHGELIALERTTSDGFDLLAEGVIAVGPFIG